MTTPPKLQFLSKTNGSLTNLNYKNYQNVIKTKNGSFFYKKGSQMTFTKEKHPNFLWRCANFQKPFFHKLLHKASATTLGISSSETILEPLPS